MANKALATRVLQEFLDVGGAALCICPGSRNSPLVCLAAAHPEVKSYYFYEERSAAFFALGLSRRTQRPVAVITTSGTAAAELMPAMTEAYYANVPLVAITADRPRSYRGTNAPQACEQVRLYGQYASWEVDLEGAETFDFATWNQRGPAHLNVCFSEPLKISLEGNELSAPAKTLTPARNKECEFVKLSEFLGKAKHPLVVLGEIPQRARAAVKNFLIRLNAPIYAEGISGLREDPSIKHLRIHGSKDIWKSAEDAGYSIDGILRIGGVPTVRLWRDLEDRQGKIEALSINEAPFSGLSWGDAICAPLELAFENFNISSPVKSSSHELWRSTDSGFQRHLEIRFTQEPRAEPSLVHALAKKIPPHSFVYLGNSQPIRHWDLAGSYQHNQLDVWATRGLNGIDGQVSTFLGLCVAQQSNWAILGDLTALYDMPGFWIAPQLPDVSFNLVIINNGGGQIFSNMYKEPQFINSHKIKFHALADLWGLHYERWESIPEELPRTGKRIIELVPDQAATLRFEGQG